MNWNNFEYEIKKWSGLVTILSDTSWNYERIWNELIIDLRDFDLTKNISWNYPFTIKVNKDNKEVDSFSAFLDIDTLIN